MTKPDPDARYRMLTVLQPWADFLMAVGERAQTLRRMVPSLADKFPKNVENRGFAPSDGWRGTIIIVAGMTPDLTALDRYRIGVDQLPRGFILGTVDLADVVEDSTSPWAQPGRKHWLVTNPRRLKSPIPWRGFQGVRIPSAELAHTVVRALDIQELTPVRG